MVVVLVVGSPPLLLPTLPAQAQAQGQAQIQAQAQAQAQGLWREAVLPSLLVFLLQFKKLSKNKFKYLGRVEVRVLPYMCNYC